MYPKAVYTSAAEAACLSVLTADLKVCSTLRGDTAEPKMV
jgi:hypothetical protein